VTICLVQPKSEEDWRQARQLIEQYAASLDVDLSFQNIGHELQHLESDYVPPAGAFLLAEEDGVFSAAWDCANLRKASVKSSACIRSPPRVGVGSAAFSPKASSPQPGALDTPAWF